MTTPDRDWINAVNWQHVAIGALIVVVMALCIYGALADLLP